MWRDHVPACVSIVLVASLCIQSTVHGRVLHQYGGNTADQLVSDGSDAPISQSSGGGNTAAAPSLDTSNAAPTDAAQPPAQQIRLRWANQVDALPPAYQAAGAGVLNDILGPSGEQTDTDGQNSSPSIQPWYNSPSNTAAAPSYAAAPETPVPTPAATQPTPSPTPVPTPSPTPVPTPVAAAPVTVVVPVATALPAVVVLAPAAAPVQAQGAEQPLLTLLGGAAPVQAPDAAPAPTPAPTPSAACSDSGTDNQMGLTVCQFMTALLPANTQTRMCSRYLPRCVAAIVAPAVAPAASAVVTAAPAPAQVEAAVPVPSSSGSTTSDAGSMLAPILSRLENIFGGSSQSGNGNSSGSGSGLAGILG
ncbi:g8588 [Coccomyxa viridis]|uniref:G8588 protein n=1 Tax=Coccomyxa viridis TaxID=1274662 RepID=A0ABP1G3B7_9CHLO